MQSRYELIRVETRPGCALHDITAPLRALVAESGVRDGFVVVHSRHTTTAVTVNEHEARLLDDIRLFLHRLVPPGDRYLHNDIHLRDCPQDEPENAHAHIAAMLLGNSATIPLVAGELQLGRWQSVMLVELDGPRGREVGVQVCGV